MPTIKIQGTDLPYNDSDVIVFHEGLIGMPHLRRMVLVRQEDIAPFLWLAPLDDPRLAFLVVDPRDVYADYAPALDEVKSRLGLAGAEAPLVLATVVVETDWSRSTVNLRAPLVLAASTMRGVQAVLADSPYRLDEPLPTAA
jgi:flagellar assembly factor FliW